MTTAPAQTDDRTPRRLDASTPDVPAWVQADAAGRWAWSQSAPWRRQARAALAPVNRNPGHGGTSGDYLLQQAQMAYRKALGARGSAIGGANAERLAPNASAQRAHAEGCICPRCRKARGEYVPDQRRQRELRDGRRVIGDQWRDSEEPLSRFGRLSELFDDGRMHDVVCQLLPSFARHMDQHRVFEALERLLREHPLRFMAFVAVEAEGRSFADVGREEGCHPATVKNRVVAAKGFMAAIYDGREPGPSSSCGTLPPRKVRRPAVRASGTVVPAHEDMATEVIGVRVAAGVRARLEEEAHKAGYSSLGAYIRDVKLAPPA